MTSENETTSFLTHTCTHIDICPYTYTEVLKCHCAGDLFFSFFLFLKTESGYDSWVVFYSQKSSCISLLGAGVTDVWTHLTLYAKAWKTSLYPGKKLELSKEVGLFDMYMYQRVFRMLLWTHINDFGNHPGLLCILFALLLGFPVHINTVSTWGIYVGSGIQTQILPFWDRFNIWTISLVL